MDNLHIRSRLAVLDAAGDSTAESLPAPIQWHNRKPHQNFVSACSSQNGTVRKAWQPMVKVQLHSAGDASESERDRPRSEWSGEGGL